MLFVSKIGRAGIALSLLATGMLANAFRQIPAKSSSNTQQAAPFVRKEEIKKTQETLRNKGHYRGNVDGVFGLRTRAGIRAYQRAETLPITGQVDSQTAVGLGVRPESTWGNSQSAGRDVGQGGDRAGSEVNNGKPSAGIRHVGRRASKTSRKEISKATAIEENGRDSANRQQAENTTNDHQ